MCAMFSFLEYKLRFKSHLQNTAAKVAFIGRGHDVYQGLLYS